MKDTEFNALKLQASICPEAIRWPTGYTHWQKLGAAVTEARDRTSRTLAAMDEVDQNPDLTIEGKAKERTRLAEKALAEFDKSEALEKARASVSYMQARWAAKVDEIIAPATDLHGVTLHSQIRDRVAGMSREDRFKFLQQHGDDVLVASALLTAPSWISNLSESELALIRSKLEKAALTPEVLEAKTQTAKALVACEKGWSNAIRIVADRGKIAPAKAG